MNEVEYILRIVLRARDHMTTALANARAELAAFTKDVDKFDASVGKLNTRISRLNTRINNVTDKFAEWRTIMRDFGADTDKVGDATDKVAKKTDDLSKSTGLATKRHKELQTEVHELGNKFIKLDESFRSGKVSREDYIADLDLISKEYDKLSKKGEIGSELSHSLRNAGNVARAHITNLKATEAEEVRIVTEAAEAKAKAEEDAEKRILEGRENRKNFVLELLDEVEKREKEVNKNIAALDKAAEEERIRIEGNRQQSVLTGLTKEEQARKAAAQESARATAATEREVKREEVARARLQQEIEQTRREYGYLTDEIERGNIRGETATGNLRTMSTAFRRLGSDLRVSEKERREFNQLSERINVTLRRGKVDVERYGHEHRRLSEVVRNAGENVGTLDNRLRGIALFAAFAFAQQLIGALVALGGELVAVASSAIMAGGAIGGNLVAGIAQAIPVTALLIGSLQRVKQVVDAVQQANKLQQQQFVQGRRDTEQAAADTDRVANAQDSLRAANEQAADAHDRLGEAQNAQRDAQAELNDARQEAERSLEDLILAEREAELAAKGAALTQKEAQEALRRAIQGGDLSEIRRAQLGILDAQIDREKSLITLRRQRTDTRAAVSGGVENMDEVVRAKEQLEAARKGIEDAKEAIDSANRGVDRAGRGLENAKRQTTDTAGAMVTAQANLAFLLSQLSPAERRLYEAMTRLQNVYRRVFIGDGTAGSGILGVIIDSFARAVNKATEILQRPDVIKAATALADEIAKQFDRITDAFTSDAALGQFLNIASDARENLGPINTIVINLGKAFLNIAEASDKAFKQLIDYVNRVVDDFLNITSDRSGLEKFFLDGERHLESWLNMFGAIGNLIAAVTGEAAGQGLRTVEKFTDFLNSSATKIRENGEDVRKFFSDTGRAAAAIYSVVKTLVVGMVEIFDPKYVENFANFLNKAFIPALLDVIRITGFITNLFASLAQNEFIARLMRYGFFALIGLQVGASALGVITYFGRLTGIFTSIAGATLAARVNLGRMLSFVGRLVAFLPGLRGIGGAIGRIGGATVAGGVAAGAARGPGGGLANIFARRGSPGNPMHVFVVNNLPGGGVGGAARTGAAAAGGAAAGSRFSRIGAGIAGGAGALVGGPVGAAAIGIPIVVIAAAENRARRAAEARGVGARAEQRFGEISNETPARLERIHDLFEKVRRKEELTTDELRDWQDVMKRFGAQGQKEVDAVIDALEKVRNRTNKALDGLSDRVRRNLSRFNIKAEDILNPNAINQVYSNFRRMRESGITSISDLRKNVQFNIDQINKGLVEGSDGWYDAISGNLSASVAATVDAMDRQVISQKDGWREIRRITRTTWVNIRDNIDNLSHDARDAIAGNFVSARRAIERQTGGWQKATGDALKEIRKLMRQELELYGLSPSQARNIARGNKDRNEQFGSRGDRGPTSGSTGISNPASGGIAGGKGALGQRARDAIPALIGAGEMVLGNIHQRYIAPAVEAFYGHPLGQTFDRVRGIHAGVGRWVGDNLGFAGGYAGRTPSGGRAVKMPAWATTGTPEFINAKVLNDALAMLRRFKMVVTDAFATSGHEGSGHLHSGTAMDVIPGPRGSWDLVDRAVQFARSKGLTVLYDGVANHGRGHHAHIELIQGAVGAIAKTVGRIIRRINRVGIGGPDSALKDIGTSALENVKAGARQLIRRVDRRMGGSAEGAEDVKGMDPDADVVAAFRRAIRTMRASPIERMALWMAGIVESRLKNLPYGDADSLGALQERVSIYGRAHAMNPFASAVRFIRQAQALRPWSGSAGALAQAVQRSAFPGRYDEVRSQAQRYFAHGGIIPGWPGKAVGIVAHGGEWVVNKLQQSRLAQLIGTSASALSSMLGFHGSVERGAQGGLNTENRTVDLNAPKMTQLERIGNITNLFMSVDELVERSETALRIIRRIARRTPNKISKMIDAFDVLTREGGILDVLREAIDRRVNRQALRLNQRRLRVGRGGVVSERLDQSQVADRELTNLREIRKDLIDEQEIIIRALRRAQLRLKRGGLSAAQKDQIRGQINGLRTRLNEAQERIAENVTAIFDAQANSIQTEVDEITSGFERKLGRVENRRRRSSAVGDLEGVEAANVQTRELLQAQADSLAEQAKRARRSGRKDVARDLEAQVDDIKTQIFESLQESLRNDADRINQEATKRSSRNDVGRRIAEALGRSTVGFDQKRIEIIRDQQTQLQGVLERATQAGNTGLAEEIRDQIDELSASIVEATQAITQNAIEEVNKNAQRRISRLDLAGRMLDATGVVGQTVAGTAGITRAGIFAQRDSALRDQRAGLQEILRQQQTLPIDQQNRQLIDDLIDQILELDVTIQENTRAAAQARFDDVNNAANFSLNVIDLNKQIIELEGQISGNTNQAALLTHAQERQNVLQNQRAALEQLLLAAQAANDQEAINQLTVAILENKVALLQNTQSINELTGATNEPQGFSSSAWQLLREAIFDGLGHLMDQYNVWNMPTPTETLADVGFLDVADSSSAANTTTTTNETVIDEGDININLHGYEQPVDPTEIAAAVGFAKKTAQ